MTFELSPEKGVGSREANKAAGTGSWTSRALQLPCPQREVLGLGV